MSATGRIPTPGRLAGAAEVREPRPHPITERSTAKAISGTLPMAASGPTRQCPDSVRCPSR